MLVKKDDSVFILYKEHAKMYKLINSLSPPIMNRFLKLNMDCH